MNDKAELGVNKMVAVGISGSEFSTTDVRVVRSTFEFEIGGFKATESLKFTVIAESSAIREGAEFPITESTSIPNSAYAVYKSPTETLKGISGKIVFSKYDENSRRGTIVVMMEMAGSEGKKTVKAESDFSFS
ncbi:hypothetical protein ACIP1X_16575 [Pseudomonas sp. NPDC088885]|uniref:hypothetical protein n=1 Tax=Pseudomonas sp. NPDC088885 TaxID=3364457 RepID=UPI003807921D